MKKIIFVLFLLSLSLFSSDKNSEDLKQKHIKKAMELEKKYSKEQKFYDASSYDFKAAEVDEKSVEKVPIIPTEDDFDMDSVYD